MISSEKIEEYVDKFLDKTYTDKDVEEVNYLLEHDIRFRKRFAPIIAMDDRLEQIRLGIFKEKNKEVLTQIEKVYKAQSDYLEAISLNEKEIFDNKPVKLKTSIFFEKGKQSTEKLQEQIEKVYNQFVSWFSSDLVQLQTASSNFITIEDDKTPEISIKISEVNLASQQFLGLFQFLESLGVEVRIQFEKDSLYFKSGEKDSYLLLLEKVKSGKKFHIILI